MTFYPYDLYFGSGTAPLFNCRTERVTKYDSSSFYNWEQDNLALYDLEEQAYYNWEKLGFPSSSLPGMILTVSADAVINETCRSKTFNDLSSAIAALPERINFPVLIEVGSFGNLGGAKINGLEFGPSGSLEIVNRNFSRGYKGLTQVSSVVNTTDSNIDQISSLSLCATLSEASCMDISTPVFSSTVDSRAANNFRAVAKYPGYAEAGASPVETSRLTVAIPNPTLDLFSSDPSTFVVTPYDSNIPATDSSNADCSTLNLMAGTFQRKGAVFNDTAGNNACNAALYGNYLGSIEIVNCNGPVYLRHFFIDGINAQETGIHIKNSQHVLLENIVAARCTKNGILIENSTVISNRGLMAYRNYGFSSGNTRLSPDWTAASAGHDLGYDTAAGLRLINSQLTVSSSISQEPTGTSANDGMFCFSRNANGIILENSILTGGIARSIASNPETQSYFEVEYSNERGIYSKNSKIELDGRLKVYNNNYGLDLINSVLLSDELETAYNQKTGLRAKNSTIIYGKNNGVKTRGSAYSSRLFGNALNPYTQISFLTNGQALDLDGCVFSPKEVPLMPTYAGRVTISAHFGTEDYLTTNSNPTRIPVINVKNSQVRLVHAGVLEQAADQVSNGRAIYGLAVRATNNSYVKFQGSNFTATRIEGPNTYTTQRRKSGIYAGRDSTIEFNGPTIIYQWAVGGLAEDNSKIIFRPHREQENGGLDISGFDLSNAANSTHVEVHSTKACLVANRGSEIIIRDLGDYVVQWSNGASGLDAIASGLTYDTSTIFNFSPYTSAGSFQFYPNPDDSDDYTGGAPVGRVAGPYGAFGFFNFLTTSATGGKYYYLNSNIFNPSSQDSVSSITGGGVCVKAVGGSKVSVENVNFPAGWWVPSGIIYDSSSGELCDRLFIWNIADKSYLHAAHVSVSGLHPLDADYHGPSAVWSSGAPGYGAPPTTPDTSSLSILDSYGFAGGTIFPDDTGALHVGERTTFENKGPFRIYVSPNSLMNYLTPANQSAHYGAAYQIYAQGYQASANLSGAGDVSSVWDDVWKWESGSMTTNKFYYTSSVLEGDSATRIMLDKAAANMFANAKHGASGKSGRLKIVTIYDAHTNIGGEAMVNSVKQAGRGFKSANVFDLGREE